MNVLLRITGSGAFGGLLAALITRATGVGMFAKWPATEDVTSEILFGAVAALFGVYLLTRSDTTHPQTLVFALACGLAWQPIMAGTSAYVKQYTSKQQAQNASTAYQSLQNSSQPPTEAQVKSAVDTTSTAIQKLPQISSADDRNQIVQAAKGVVDQVAANKTVDASYKIEALKNLGVASVSADSTAVSIQTVQGIQSLADTSSDPAVKKDAAAAISVIHSQATARNMLLPSQQPAVAIQNGVVGPS